MDFGFFNALECFYRARPQEIHRPREPALQVGRQRQPSTGQGNALSHRGAVAPWIAIPRGEPGTICEEPPPPTNHITPCTMISGR